jgi:hypothetical protein
MAKTVRSIRVDDDLYRRLQRFIKERRTRFSLCRLGNMALDHGLTFMEETTPKKGK